MVKAVSILCVAGFLLTGCCTNQPAKPTSKGMPGSDRDAHGCIGSAGYSWCERAKKCVRPWELAKEAGFENTEEAFLDYCR